MKNKNLNSKTIQLMLIIFLIIISGCILEDRPSYTSIPTVVPMISNTPTIQGTIFPTAIITETVKMVIRPTITEMPTPTFVPVITPDEKQLTLLIKLLKSDTCELPCFLNIRPGITSWEEAKTILENVGAEFEGKYSFEPGQSYQFTLNFLMEYYSITLTIENDKVQRMFITTYNNRNVDFYQNWSKYSIYHTLIHLGKPDEVFINIDNDFHSYGVAMIYKQQKMSLEWVGDMKQKSKWVICPASLTDQTWSFDFSITNPSSDYGLFSNSNGRITPYNRKVWHPIMETSGVDEQTFYNMMISDSNACIKAIWK
jgi:hypothetical protein